MTRNASRNTKRKKQKNSTELLEFVQDFIPVRSIHHGIIETMDNRYIKILEIEPINFMLRSEEEQFNIISSFASWLKISPQHLQFKSITRKADSDRHVRLLRQDLEGETNEECRRQAEGYIRFVRDVGNREALTRRFFLIYQCEEQRRGDSEDFGLVYSTIQTVEQNARAYFMQCGNTIVQHKDPDQATAEILYMFFNRRSCVEEPFESRVNRVVVDSMAARNLVIGVDAVPKIRINHFISPRGVDFTHNNYIIMDGLYYCFLYIRGNGYPSRVRAGWMSTLINAGDGIDIDVHLHRENRSKTIDKVAQRIRLNRTKLKSMQDTSTDYEELTNSIQAGYYIKQGIANYNEDLFYLSVFVTVSAKSLDELMWRKQQMVDMLKSMDMYVSDCGFQQEAAFSSVMPFLKLDPKLDRKSRRNVLTSGAASSYMFTSFEMSDDAGVLLGINRHNNSLCIVDLFNTKKNKNANLNILGTSGAGKAFTMQLLALRMRMRGIQCFTGSVSILKTDSVTGAALAGAHFKLTDASGNLVKEGDTGSDGKLTFSGIPIGTYYLSETAAPNGYVLDSTPVTVEITTGGQTVSKTFVDAPAVGSIAVTKTDAASGAALAGVHFKLVDTNGSTVKEGDTDSNGTLSFTNVPLGNYQLIETATVDGYVLDSTPVAVELTQANQTVTKNLTNARTRGSVLIRKTASDTGYALAGVQFELLDQSGAVAASGVTGSDGTLLLENLPLGAYTLKETQTISGYALKTETIPVSVTQHGQTVEVSVTNDPVIGSLKIIKKAAGENTPLSGAGYRLFSQDGTQLSEGYTNDAGELLFEGIPYGSGYYYQEFAAPKGFVLDEGKYPLAVTETESAVVKTHENRRREGTLQVLKQDHQGQPLSNALFLLEYSQDNGKTWTPVTSRASGDAVTLGGCTSFGLTNGQLVSGTDGKAVFTGLRADGSTIYRVTETRAPQGYSLMADPLYVGTLPVAVSDANIADSETVDGTVYTYSLYITATDNPIYRLPETGGHGFRFFPIGLFF